MPPSAYDFISRYVRSVEQLEILLLVSKDPAATWSSQQVYDTILSTPQSVERWLEELARNGLVEKLSDPETKYRRCDDGSLLSQIAALADLYRTTPVRVIETIYKRQAGAAQSFADAFKIKNPDQNK